ncbi:MAG: hypothetical protein ACFB13_01130 [Kiloniellaceae bacterium]
MTRLAALDSGTYYHHRTLYEERYRHFFDAVIYARQLGEVRLEDYDILLVSCRTDPSLLRPHHEKIAQYLAAGGTAVAMGSTGPHQWLPGVIWHDRPTNFWWWKEGGSLGLQCVDSDHPLFGRVTLQDATWHYHGFFDPPQGARTLIAAGGGAILYEDRVTTPGCMIVTSLDPMYHHGSYFMPATTRFLDGFLPYLKTDHRPRL